MTPNQVFQIGVCGSTTRTVQCAQSLLEDGRFSLQWVVTPSPKPIGRKQLLTPSPLETWAYEHDIPVIHVEKSLKPLQPILEKQTAVDFLLVVDFGYLVPDWLLNLPHLAPINIHPSALPKYRGSSPAQFALLFGGKESAVCIMRMTAGLDEGPIIRSLAFPVAADETAETYYQKAFALASSTLPDTLVKYAIDRQETPQPEKSTTPIAKRFSREDGYIPYSIVEALENGKKIPRGELSTLGPALREVLAHQPNLPVVQLLERAVRALSPWPGVWTIVPHYKGRDNVRQKILTAHIAEDGKLMIDRSQFEGEQPLTLSPSIS